MDKKPNILSAAEISAEENYNFVGDGVINNVPAKSIFERMKEFDENHQFRHVSEYRDKRREFLANARKEASI